MQGDAGAEFGPGFGSGGDGVHDVVVPASIQITLFRRRALTSKELIAARKPAELTNDVTMRLGVRKLL